MWEVFDPKDGRPVKRVSWEWQARLITRLVKGLDYERPGEGWGTTDPYAAWREYALSLPFDFDSAD